MYTGRARGQSQGYVEDDGERPRERARGRHGRRAPCRIALTNPIGCNVKWLGKDAHWMPAEACDLVPAAERRLRTG